MPSNLHRRLRSFFAADAASPNPPARLFWVAFFVRLLYMTLARTWRVNRLEDHFKFGFEAGRIASALVHGFGYADPFSNAFVQHTGPTAWLPPLYPLFLAGVFKLFGVYTPLSAWVVFALQSAASALIAVATWRLGLLLTGSRRNALWSGWLWALYPAAMQYAVGWIWEMTFTCALFAWVLVLTMRMRRDPARHPLRRWLLFGLAWGLIALSNSTLLLFLPVCGIWILLGAKPALRPHLLGAVAAAVVFLACVVPWTVRNQRVFGRFIPLRGNLGAELAMGNGPGANGFLMEYDHPFQSAVQLRRYCDLGEVRYVAERGALARATIAADPARFIRDTALRVYMFWISVPHPWERHPAAEIARVLTFAALSLLGLGGLVVALRRRLPGAGLWAWAFMLLPLPYYPVTVHARFRHPLEPLLTVLAVLLIQSAEPRGSLTPAPPPSAHTPHS